METKNILYLLLLLIVIFIIGSILNSTLNKEYWGTVADWSMIAITTVTAYYLYQTLKSQQKVQEDQEKINKLNTLEIRRNNKPIINFNHVRRTNGGMFHFSLNISNNVPYNLKISSETYYASLPPNIIYRDDNLYQLKFLTVPLNNNLEFATLTVDLQQLENIENSIIKYTLEYEDEFNFKYSTQVDVVYNSQTYRTTHNQKNDIYH